jgi:OmpA-OmpF porin, OOP family
MNISRFKLLSTILCLCVIMAIQAQNPKRTAIHKHHNLMKSHMQSRHRNEAHYNDKDSDGDGVLDINDKCPGMGKKKEVTPFGCPLDKDFDGVFDVQDACIDKAGPVENHGCPWPDTDGDGIPNKDDKCLTVKGIAQFEGCPDTDGDGIIDLDDNCPKEKGTWENKGCPPKDTDADGILDADDACPKTPGIPELRGCPPLKPEDKEAVKKAFDNLLFKTGSDIIDESSFTSLSDLARVLINNPASKLRLEGHTDDVGDDNNNLILSKKRALSVQNFLIGKGVDSQRITSEGYGETKPKFPNVNDGNRKVNRRVEMIMTFD